jgi:hypothetical protein
VRLLVQLLSCGLQPRRRGKWWERLSVDLGHNLHRHDYAIAACAAALRDPHVEGGRSALSGTLVGLMMLVEDYGSYILTTGLDVLLIMRTHKEAT